MAHYWQCISRHLEYRKDNKGGIAVSGLILISMALLFSLSTGCSKQYVCYTKCAYEYDDIDSTTKSDKCGSCEECKNLNALSDHRVNMDEDGDCGCGWECNDGDSRDLIDSCEDLSGCFCEEDVPEKCLASYTPPEDTAESVVNTDTTNDTLSNTTAYSQPKLFNIGIDYPSENVDLVAQKWRAAMNPAILIGMRCPL
jgi:hypothetical protein